MSLVAVPALASNRKVFKKVKNEQSTNGDSICASQQKQGMVTASLTEHWHWHCGSS